MAALIHGTPVLRFSEVVGARTVSVFAPLIHLGLRPAYVTPDFAPDLGVPLGVTPGQDGRARAGFEVSTTINRLDYGVSWNRAVEGGGVMLGDEVTIEITIEAVKQGD